ncbi:hypothetical protein ACX80W_09100 [Arthrobacter sp. TMN-37]
MEELTPVGGLVIDLAGLFVAAALLVTLVTLDVRHARAGAGPSAPAGGRMGGRALIAVMWILCVLLFLPRVVGLLV